MHRIRKLMGQGFRAMGRHRLRTFFMMLGPFVGVLALILVLAAGERARRQTLDRLDRLLSGSSILVSGGSMGMGGGPHASPRATLTLDDLAAVAATVDGVVAWDPLLMIGGREVNWEGNTRNVRVLGHSERAPLVWGRGVSRGSFFRLDDVVSGARVALIGATLARDLFAGADPIGQRIQIGSVPFEVLGVLDVQGADPHGMDRDNEVHVPITTAMRRVAHTDYIGGAKILVTERADLDGTARAIGAVLRDRHALADGAPDDFATHTPVQARARMAEANRVFTLFLPLLAGVSIVVGGLVVSNLLVMGVSQRRGEIGLRRAVGARSRDISLQFLVEACVVTLSAGLLAVVAGALVLGLSAHLHGTSGGMPWRAALVGLASSMVVGLAAGILPARRAAALDPVQALR